MKNELLSDDKFNLQVQQAFDCPALVKLITDFDGDMTTQFLVDAYTALILAPKTAPRWWV